MHDMGWECDDEAAYVTARAAMVPRAGGRSRAGLWSRCVARQPGASTTLKPTSTVKRAVYDALLD